MDDSTGKPMDLRWAEKHQPGAILCVYMRAVLCLSFLEHTNRRFGSYPCVFKPRSSRVEKVIREIALHGTA
jgi:hypothetical protein